MQYHEWQTKYTHLLNLAEKHVHYSRRYEDFRADADKKQRNHFAREIDKAVSAEKERRDSKQGELL